MRRLKKAAWVAAVVVSFGLLTGLVLHEYKKEQYQNELIELARTEKGKYNPERIVLADTDRESAEEIAASVGAKLRTTTDGSFAVLYLPEGVEPETVFAEDSYKNYMKEMSLDYYAYVSELEENDTFPSVSSLYSYNDKLFESQDYLDYVNIGDAWNVTDGSGVTVAVIDTGIDTDHPEFAGKISEYSYNASEDKVVKDYGLSVIEDEQGHGTSVAGVIAAAADNEDGIVGIAPGVELLVIKCECDSFGGFTSTSDLVFGLAYAVERNADVVNMSFGSMSSQNPFARYTALAADSDIICVAAAGNEGCSCITYPAADENVIGVGALDIATMELAAYSNFGENCDIVAPGTTMTAENGGSYKAATGTSLASPIVAAGIALYLSENPYTEYAVVREMVAASGRDLGDPGEDWYYGFGAFDIGALVCEEVGTLTLDPLTDELKTDTARFVRNHTLQQMPEPERESMIFDGWYYDIELTDEYVYYEDAFGADTTLYAKWINEEEGLPYTYVTLDDGTVEIRSYTGKRRYISVPDTIEGKIVSSIGDFAFACNHTVRSIELPENLEKISQYAFQNCSQLTAIEIPDTVTVIENNAFESCVRLGSAILPANGNLREIGAEAFAYCGRLQRLELPAQLTSLSSNAFYGATSLFHITVATGNPMLSVKNDALYSGDGILLYYPAGRTGIYEIASGTEQIGAYAFAFSGAKRVVFPESVTYLGNYAFANSRLQQVAIPAGTQFLGMGAFYGCGSLENVTFAADSTLAVLPKFVFSNCESLKSITLPEAVQGFDEGAFKGSGLVTAKFKELSNLKVIGNEAFAECMALTEVELPDGLAEIGTGAFSECSSLSKVVLGADATLQNIYDKAFYNCRTLAEMDFPDTVEAIGSLAFANSDLISVELPAALTQLGEGAFAYCTDLSGITVASGNTAYTATENVLLSADGSVLHTYPAGKVTKSYLVPFGVTEVASYAFAGNKSLQDIQLPDGVASVGKYAFSKTVKLATIALPNSVCAFGENAFEYCSALEGVTIPRETLTLPRNMFLCARKLSDVIFTEDSKISRLGNGAFYGTALEHFTVPASVSTMGQGVFSGCTELQEVIFATGSKLDTIAAWTFEGAERLTAISFEAGSALQMISAQSMKNLPALQRLDLSGCTLLEEIGNDALAGCASLKELDLPESLKAIGRYAFSRCSALEDLMIPAQVEFIGRYAFEGTGINAYFAAPMYPAYLQDNWDVGLNGYYVGVSEVVRNADWEYAVLSDGTVGVLEYLGSDTAVVVDEIDGMSVSMLGNGVFENNLQLRSVELPDTLTTVGKNAFRGTTNLGSVLIPANVTVIDNGAFENSGVAEVTFAENSSLTVIGRYAFAGTKSLMNLQIPSAVEEIRAYAFYRSKVQTVTFEEGSALTTIGNSAFRSSGLVSLVLPDNLERVSYYAFADNTSLESVDFGNSGQVRIDDYAFHGSGIKDVVISAGVNYIGDSAFGGCLKLTSFTVDSDNEAYTAKDGILFDKAMQKLILCPANKTGSYTVPDTVLSIRSGAFENSRLSEVNFTEDSELATIGYRTFLGAAITEITIPDSVFSVGYYAFGNCERLQKVQIGPESQLYVIGKGAFDNCTSLQSFYVPEGVKELEARAFYGAKALNSLEFANLEGVLGYGAYALAYTAVDEIRIASGADYIEDYAFAGTNITTVVVPNSLYEIGYGVFADCDKLEHMTLPFVGRRNELLTDEENSFSYVFAGTVPSSVKHVVLSANCVCIGRWAFQNLSGLESVAFLGTITSIEDSTFRNCTSLRDVVLPQGLKVIEREAFLGTALTDLVLPDTVERLGWSALAISSLRSIDLSENLSYLEAGALNGTQISELTLPESLTYIGDAALAHNRNLTKLVIPDSVEYIGEYAFMGCSALEKVTLGNGIQDFGEAPFSECPQVSFVMDSAHPYLVNRNGLIYNADFTRLFAITADASGDVVLPEGFTNIGRIFEGSAITSITLPAGTTEIAERAFAGCEQLENIVLPEGLIKIGHSAFVDCRSLIQLTLPSTLQEIEMGVFLRCLNLEQLTIPVAVTEIGAGVFDQCDKLILTIEEANTVYKCVDGIVYSKDGTELKFCVPSVAGDITVPEGVQKILGGSFSSCSEVTSVTLPDSVTEIGCAFQSCGLKKINIPAGVSRIESGTFLCAELEEIEIEGELSYIGQGAFELTKATEDVNGIYYVGDYVVGSDKRITVADLREGTLGIAASAFMDCTELTKITLPEGLRWIEDYAFENCAKILKVELPASLQNISEVAFDGCTSVKSLVYRGAVTEFSTLGITSLEYLEIPDSVETIAGELGCPNLKFVRLPDLEELKIDNRTRVETLVLSPEVKQIREFGVYGYDALKHLVILSPEFTFEEYALPDWEDAEIFCNAKEGDTNWVTYGLDEDVVVHYKDTWHFATFYSDGIVLSAEPLLISEVMEVPAANTVKKESDGAYNYEFIGWDINADGAVDQLPTVLYEDLTAVAVFEATPVSRVEVNEETFPDANFRAYVLQEFDVDGNGFLGDAEIAGITKLFVEQKGIKDLKGIEHFTNLAELSCWDNELTSLDISKNTELTRLNCDANALQGLDVSQNTKLTYLYCSDNAIQSLDVSKNVLLACLSCGNNALQHLDVSQNTSLEFLYCYGNALRGLDVSQNTLLVDLSCANNALQGLDVSNNTKLIYLRCENNLFNVCAVDGTIDTSKFMYFDGTKASNWSNNYDGSCNEAVYNPETKLITGAETDFWITYTYDMGNGYTGTFNLCPIEHVDTDADTLCDNCGSLVEDSNEDPDDPDGDEPIPSDPIEAFVTRMYQVILEREPDAGSATWVNGLKDGSMTGVRVADGFVLSEEMLNKDISNEEFVKILYRAFFGREADEGGLATWKGLLDNGCKKTYVFAGFANSTEFGNLCADAGIVQGRAMEYLADRQTGLSEQDYKVWCFVERMYTEVLGRTADEAGVRTWVGVLQDGSYTGVKVADGFFTSEEFLAKDMNGEEYVQVLYRAFFNRNADPEGLATWTNALATGWTKQRVFAGFANSNEFGVLCEQAGIVKGTATEQ